MANDCIRQKMYAHKYDSNEAWSMEHGLLGWKDSEKQPCPY